MNAPRALHILTKKEPSAMFLLVFLLGVLTDIEREGEAAGSCFQTAKLSTRAMT
jgi:hypothetical protein